MIYRASKAAGPIADWIKATVKYAEILEQTTPLRKKLNAIKNRQKKVHNKIE